MPAQTAPFAGDDLLVAVTEAMVALHERYHHRTPVTAKTLLLDDELLACVLGGVYTDVEQTMIELQHTAIVKQTRSTFQSATQQKFIGAIERLSGREVLTFISGHHVGPDLELKLFMLNASLVPEVNTDERAERANEQPVAPEPAAALVVSDGDACLDRQD